MRAHCDNALELAGFLEGNPKLERVAYPGLASHPQHAPAGRQMHGYGGMLSIWLKGGFDAAKDFMERPQLFVCAESLGGDGSLANHPAVMTHASVPAERRLAPGVTDNLVRTRVGGEDGGDRRAGRT